MTRYIACLSFHFYCYVFLWGIHFAGVVSSSRFDVVIVVVVVNQIKTVGFSRLFFLSQIVNGNLILAVTCIKWIAIGFCARGIAAIICNYDRKYVTWRKCKEIWKKRQCNNTNEAINVTAHMLFVWSLFHSKLCICVCPLWKMKKAISPKNKITLNSL